MEGRAKADLPKLRAMPLFNWVSNGIKELHKALPEHDQQLTHLLSMFADGQKVKIEGRERRVVWV